MAVFPRATRARPRLATPPRFPAGFQNWSQSGRGNFRSFQNVGRSWEETYPVLDTALPAVRALIEAINRSLREPVLWDVQHPYLHQLVGVGGGSPVVASQFRQVWQVDEPSTFVDETTDANDVGANDWAFFPAGAGANDYVAMGFPVPFGQVDITVGTAGAGTYTVVWEYSIGGSWAALTNVVDPTDSFKLSGLRSVTFTIPTDWTSGSINGTPAQYYIRARRNGGTVTTDPIGTSGAVRAKQYGYGLPVDAAPVSQALWLRAGDIVHAVGGAVVFDATADVNVDARGHAVIPIHPPIFPGAVPADGAIVTVNPANIYYKAVLTAVQDFPHIDSTRFLDAGMSLTWRESPI